MKNNQRELEERKITGQVKTRFETETVTVAIFRNFKKKDPILVTSANALFSTSSTESSIQLCFSHFVKTSEGCPGP